MKGWILGIVAVAFIVCGSFVISRAINRNRPRIETVEYVEVGIESMGYGYDMEYAYFEGQKDAIEGDVRIKRTPGGDYIWIKNPWDDSDTPPGDNFYSEYVELIYEGYNREKNDDK